MTSTASPHPRSPLSVLLLAAALLLPACGGDPGEKDGTPAKPPKPKERLTILCTMPILHEIISKIAGDKADITSLTKPGDPIEPFDLRAGDVLAIKAADLVFVHGLKLEGAALETIAAHAAPQKVIALAEGSHVRSRPVRALVSLSPVCWIDPGIYALMVAEARDALCKADAKNAAIYTQRCEAYLKEISELSAWIAETAGPLKEDRGGVITNSPAVAELARCLNMPSRLIDLASTKQPTVADRDRLLALMNESKARAIAIDPGGNQALAEMLLDVAKITGARTVSPPIVDWPRSEKDTYIALMKANVEALLTAIK